MLISFQNNEELSDENELLKEEVEHIKSSPASTFETLIRNEKLIDEVGDLKKIV